MPVEVRSWRSKDSVATQYDAAGACGCERVGYSELAALERGQRNPTFGVLQGIAQDLCSLFQKTHQQFHLHHSFSPCFDWDMPRAFFLCLRSSASMPINNPPTINTRRARTKTIHDGMRSSAGATSFWSSVNAMLMWTSYATLEYIARLQIPTGGMRKISAWPKPLHHHHTKKVGSVRRRVF